MNETEFKPCPFCGKSVDECWILRHKYGDWSFNHHCGKADEELTIFISVYGKTKEELIERWNSRADNEHHT